MSDIDFESLRAQMLGGIVAHTIFETGRLGKASLDRRVLDVMGRVPRHAFVQPGLEEYAYADTPLPSGCGKTISQPFIVALMTDLLDLRGGERVLEIGTGLGYQTAVLSALAGTVFSVELIEELSRGAARRLAALGCRNVHLRVGDGHAGWPEHAPYDRILVTAAPETVPPALLAQLSRGGRLVLPLGAPDAQRMVVVSRDARGELSTREVLPVRFSPLESRPLLRSR